MSNAEHNAEHVVPVDAADAVRAELLQPFRNTPGDIDRVVDTLLKARDGVPLAWPNDVFSIHYAVGNSPRLVARFGDYGPGSNRTLLQTILLSIDAFNLPNFLIVDSPPRGANVFIDIRQRSEKLCMTLELDGLEDFQHVYRLLLEECQENDRIRLLSALRWAELVDFWTQPKPEPSSKGTSRLAVPASNYPNLMYNENITPESLKRFQRREAMGRRDDLIVVTEDRVFFERMALDPPKKDDLVTQIEHNSQELHPIITELIRASELVEPLGRLAALNTLKPQLISLIDSEMIEAAADFRRSGGTWRQIGEELGITPQGAQGRFDPAVRDRSVADARKRREQG